MAKTDSWQHVVKALQNIRGLDADPIDPRWVLCYTDGIRNIAVKAVALCLITLQ
jgi:hypothetical protein